MAQGQSTKIISMMKWIQTSRLSINNSLCVPAGEYRRDMAKGTPTGDPIHVPPQYYPDNDPSKDPIFGTLPLHSTGVPRS